jgi:site-specific DNA-methyltransferase (adenine-specific)
MYSHHITKESYQFVPVLDFKQSWTEQKLYKKYLFEDNDIQVIEKNIKPFDKQM